MTVRELLRILADYEFEDEILLAHARPGDVEAEFDSVTVVEDMNGPVLCSHEYRSWYIAEAHKHWKVEGRPELTLVKG